MHEAKFTRYPQYADWLVNQCYATRQAKEATDMYRLVGIKYTEFDNCRLKIKIINNNKCFETTPESIAQNEVMMLGFPRHDVRTITYLACEEIRKPKFIIMGKEICKKTHKTILKILNRKKETNFKKPACEVSNDKEMLSKMSSIDTHLISYIVANEAIQPNSIAKVRNLAQFNTLSKREAECLVLLLKGKTAKEMGKILKISAKSAESYLDKVKSKVKCYTRSQLFDKAIRGGLIAIIPPESLLSPLQ
jgi:DNA-binding CsgD family transcriptional regulator